MRRSALRWWLAYSLAYWMVWAAGHSWFADSSFDALVYAVAATVAGAGLVAEARRIRP